MLNLFIDTSVLLQEGFESKNMQLLLRLGRALKLVVYISDLVRKEYISNKLNSLSDILNDANRKLDKFKKRAPLKEGQEQKLKETKQIINDINDELSKMVHESFDEWLSEMEGEVIEFNPSWSAEVIDEYFLGSGAFRAPKSRNDFPDAFIMCAIRETIEYMDEDEPLFVCVKDGYFRKSIERLDKVKAFSNLRELLTQKEFVDELRYLDEESERIQEIKSFLISEECHDLLYSRLKSEGDFFDIKETYIENPDIKNYHTPIAIKESSNTLLLIHSKDILNVKFGPVENLEDETYSIEVHIEASATFRFLVDYGMYLELENEGVNLPDIYNVDDDECILIDDVIANFHGYFEMFIANNMKVSDLSIHMKYLRDDDNPIDAILEIENASIGRAGL